MKQQLSEAFHLTGLTSSKVTSNRGRHPETGTLLMSDTVEANSGFLHVVSYSTKQIFEKNQRKIIVSPAGPF